MSETAGPQGVPPLVLITGPEEVLAERALDETKAAVRAASAQVELLTLDGGSLTPGELTLHTSPSLFGEDRLVILKGIDAAQDAVHDELLAYVEAVDPSITLVVIHGGGQRGKRVLDALRKAGALVHTAPAIKTDRDKADFVTSEFARDRRRIDPEAVHALIEAVGKDTLELRAACRQLLADSQGTVDAQLVQRYYAGKVEATGFRVADAALAGNAAEALRLLRHALAAGLDPVPVVAVLAAQLRQLVKVSGAGRGRSADLAKILQLAPWQVDKAQRQLRGWEVDALGRCIQAVAAADFDVKGGSRDPVYAVERVILTIVRERHGRPDV